MGGATIFPRSLKTTRNDKKFQDRSKIFLFFKSYIYDPLIFANNRFSKIRSIISGRDGFLCQFWAKMSKFIPPSLRLSGIEFSLV
jgi:hypothetical protein